jgi:hypothetical protein
MRETWVPFFQDIRQSSMWAYDAETFKIWMTLLTMVDPEGYVCAAIPGIAIAAGIPVEKTREAMALFEAPDPDSRSQEHEGRRIQRVPRGWLMLGFEEHKRRAREEAEKARKRRWARLNREAEATEPAEPIGGCCGPTCVGCIDPFCCAPLRGVAPSSENVDASKSESKSKSKSGAEDPEPAPPVMVFTLDGWEPSAELRADAKLACVPDLDERIARLRTTRIGGRSGVRRDKVDDYIRSLFRDWRIYRETAAAKTQGGMPPEPAAPKPPRVPGMPKWVSPAHVELARRLGWNLRDAVKRFAKAYHLPVNAVAPALLEEPFRRFLEDTPKAVH